jgi:hypothetical protein
MTRADGSGGGELKRGVDRGRARTREEEDDDDSTTSIPTTEQETQCALGRQIAVARQRQLWPNHGARGEARVSEGEGG